MKLYGTTPRDMNVCLRGCCGYKRNPGIHGSKTNIKPLLRRLRKAARQNTKKLIAEIANDSLIFR